jgi:uncharacterized membrane protein
VKIQDSRPARSRVIVLLAACGFAASLLLTACSSGGAPKSHASNSNATAQIEANWSAFFNGKTTAAKKISVLQNGSQFATYIRSQENTPIAKATSVKVNKVNLTSKTSAKVTYTIYLDGHPQLAGSVGTAVYQDKAWKVSDTSFCALLTLEGTASKVKACASAK